MLGDADVAVAGGAESMSRGLYGLKAMRWGQRMGNGETVDMVVGALTDPFETIHMGETAENVAAKFGITREQQDALALESQKRAAAAIAAGRFKEQILPVELKSRKGTTIFDTDEHVRADTTPEAIAKLKPAFRAGGTVTAGNASGINDAAASVVLMEAGVAKAEGRTPLGAARQLRQHRRRSQLHGHRPRLGLAQGPGTGRIDDRRHRRHRGE